VDRFGEFSRNSRQCRSGASPSSLILSRLFSPGLFSKRNLLHKK
jgi:hypothetical protein